MKQRHTRPPGPSPDGRTVTKTVKLSPREVEAIQHYVDDLFNGSWSKTIRDILLRELFGGSTNGQK